MRYKITIEYDGSYYCGWQRQDGLVSIQGSIEEALKNTVGYNVDLFGSGRTDAGVHALNQVAHFDLNSDFSEYKIVQALNFYLREQTTNRYNEWKKIVKSFKIQNKQIFYDLIPFIKQDISIKSCEKVSDEFDARFSATERSYKYYIYNSRVSSALMQNRAWWVVKELNIEKMEEASKFLIGRMDFSSFRAAECQAKSPVKTVNYCSFSKNDDLIIFEIKAKSFLHHMVRNIIGTLKDVGTGKITIDDFKKIIDSKDRKIAGVTAPAYGLYLDKIRY